MTAASRCGPADPAPGPARCPCRPLPPSRESSPPRTHLASENSSRRSGADPVQPGSGETRGVVSMGEGPAPSGVGVRRLRPALSLAERMHICTGCSSFEQRIHSDTRRYKVLGGAESAAVESGGRGVDWRRCCGAIPSPTSAGCSKDSERIHSANTPSHLNSPSDERFVSVRAFARTAE